MDFKQTANKAAGFRLFYLVLIEGFAQYIFDWAAQYI